MKRLLLIAVVFFFFGCLGVFGQSEQLESEGMGAVAVAYQADSYRDPFMPVIKKEKQAAQQGNLNTAGELTPPEFEVKGMIWNTNRPQAIIDGQILRLGDEIKDAKIIEISKEGVKLLFRGRIITAKPKIGK